MREELKEIILESWVNGDREKCVQKIQKVIERDYLDKQKVKEVIALLDLKKELGIE